MSIRQTVLRSPPADSLSQPGGGAGVMDPPVDFEKRVQQLQAQFDVLKAQVRQAQQLAGLGVAAAMIAHEVNNLLTPLRAYAQTALEGNDPELQRKALSVTLRNSEMLMAMSDRVLHISAAKPADRQPVRIRNVVEDALATLCRDPAKDGIRFLMDIDPALTAWVDALQLQQVLFNLMLNARNAMAKTHQGKLTVAASRQGDEVTILVRDTGPGIPSDLLPRVFDPLQSSKPVERNGHHRCSGLGLALCRDLVEENGGSITVTSVEGTGTTFTISLPAHQPGA